LSRAVAIVVRRIERSCVRVCSKCMSRFLSTRLKG
jgi:hypothetical protein